MKKYYTTDPQQMVQKNKSIQAVVFKNFRAICQPLSAFEKLKAQFLHQGSNVFHTQHFLIVYTSFDELITLVHAFSAESIDNNVVYHLMKEVAPYGLVNSERAFGAALMSIVTSICPHDPIAAWGHFSLNTLNQLRKHLDTDIFIQEENFITSFTTIYRRLFELKIGSSLLDVGCACAFWPILVAERFYDKSSRIVGVDNRLDAINLSTQLAARAKVDILEFVLADVLTSQFTRIGTFDTVTAIHLLEHLPETQIPHVLRHLLNVTRQRLIIAVPYESQPERAYGHEQVWTHEKLEKWGQWSVEHLLGGGSAYCEDVQGGLLIIERPRMTR